MIGECFFLVGDIKIATMWRILFFIFFSILCSSPSNGYEIPFMKYCADQNNTEEVIPKDGKESSGPLILSANRELESWYMPGLNCSVTLATENNFYLFLTFSNVSLRNSSFDNLTVSYDNDNTTAILSGQQVCSNENCVGLKFFSGQFNNMTLKFITANATIPSNLTGFIAHYTVFDVADPKTGACRGKNRFLCENKNCVSYDLVCDGHNNCGDLSDETKCIIPVKNTVWGIIVIVVAILAIVLFVPMFIFLATSGTRSIVKSTTVPNQPTPMVSAVDCGETSGLLTSSEAISQCWPSASYERRNSFTYGTTDHEEALKNTEVERKYSTVVPKPENNQFL